jgi:hypothetical protein
MITNLLATITICLVTNTVEHFPMQRVPDMGPPSKYGSTDAVYWSRMVPVENPTQKDVVTEISEVKTFSFEFEGQPQSVKSVHLLSSVTNHLELHNDWLPSTNSLPGTSPFDIMLNNL